ncbi:MAG: toxic anion resistance protein [Oscillospiraceae bacterium]
MSDITLADLARNKTASEQTKIIDAAEVKYEPAEAQFSDEDRAKIDQIKESIDFMDTQATVQYGVGAQKNLTEFADSILQTVRSRDGGQVGELLCDLVTEVKSIEAGGDKGRFSLFKNPVASLKKLKERYTKAEAQIDRIEAALEKERMCMLKDIGMFDMMYQENLRCFKELEIYIAAGREKVSEMREKAIPQLRKEAAATGDPMDAQMVKDFEDTVDRFEKKIYDLELSRTIAIQSAPQIKLIQNNDRVLVDKIQTAIMNTIPIWKSQFVIAVGLNDQQRVLKMQREITDATNEMLVRNSELLKTNSVETAKESNRGIVDIETLEKVNQNLISTIEETIKIQQEGREKRQAAEAALGKIEGELKNKLLEIRQ